MEIVQKRVQRSFKIDSKLWDTLKIHCIEEKVDISLFVEELIKKELKK